MYNPSVKPLTSMWISHEQAINPPSSPRRQVIIYLILNLSYHNYSPCKFHQENAGADLLLVTSTEAKTNIYRIARWH